MITGMQGAKLRAANNLKSARNAMLDSIALVCIDASDRATLHDAVNRIDIVFGNIVTNVGASGEDA